MSKPVFQNPTNQPSTNRLARLKKTAKVIALTFFLIWLCIYLVIWVFSPMAVKHFAAQPLHNLNLSLAPESTVRFNPFTSTLSVDDLAVLDESKRVTVSIQEAEVSVHLHRLLLSELYISAFSVSEVFLGIQQKQGQLFIAGIDVLSTTAGEKESVSQTQSPESTSHGNADTEPSKMTLVLPELRFNQLAFDIQIEDVDQHVVLSDMTILNTEMNLAEQMIDLSINALVNNAPLAFSTSIDLNDQVGTVTSNISLEAFALASISPLLEKQGISTKGLLSISASPVVQIEKESVSISNSLFTLQLDELELNTSPWLVNAKQNSININDLEIQSRLDGELISAKASLSTAFNDGNVSISQPHTQARTQANTQAHTQGHNSAVNWQSIQLNSELAALGLSPNVFISELVFTQLNMSQDLSLTPSLPMLALGELSINSVELTDKSADIKQIGIKGLSANIEIAEDKSIVGLIDTSALSNEPSDVTTQSPASVTEPAISDAPIANKTANTTANTTEQSPPFAITLDKFIVLDTGKINITDRSVKPIYAQTLSIDTLQAGPFDSLEPDLQSPFELIISDPKYLKISAGGFVSPFADTLNAAVNAKVVELNLPSVSPYVANALGFDMKSGQLDVNIDVNVSNDEIKGNTNLFLRGIEMSGANDVEQGAISQGKAMPLNAALGVLKDDKGNIDLDVPLRGNVAEPSFGAESFLALVLKKAAMSQAKDYLMTTFVPYASVVSVALSGAEYLLKISLEPLVFETSVAELPEQSSEFLSQLALLMNDTPDLQIKTCAQVTYADLGIANSGNAKLSESQTISMAALGDARQDNLKRFLVEQGIASNRILHCASTLDSADKALPRIELKTD